MRTASRAIRKTKKEPSRRSRTYADAISRRFYRGTLNSYKLANMIDEMVSETYSQCLDIVYDARSDIDPRLKITMQMALQDFGKQVAFRIRTVRDKRFEK